MYKVFVISIWYFWQCNHITGEFYEDFKISKKLQKGIASGTII